MDYRDEEGKPSAYAREADGRITKQSHISSALDMNKSEVSEQISILVEERKISTEGGRIWLRADNPAPVLVRPKRYKKGEDKAYLVAGSVNFSESERQFLAGLEATDKAAFRVAAARIIAAHWWGQKVQADAVAWGRKHSRETRQQVFTELGYTETERRGNKTKDKATPETTFKIDQSFEKFTVLNEVDITRVAEQFTVLPAKSTLNSEVLNSVQTPHPYSERSEVLSRSASSHKGAEDQAAAKQAELEAEQSNRALKTQLKTDLASRLARAGMVKMGAVTIDAGTQNNIVAVLFALAKLPKANVRGLDDVLDTIEKRASEIVKGTRSVDDVQAYLVGIAKGELAKRTGAKDLNEQVRAAAAGKGRK
jgi:hypothetical protein